MKPFTYKTTILWTGEKKGRVSSSNKISFDIATPPEFNGHAGFWGPEELLVASVNSCVMTTFLYFADKKGLELCGYHSKAEGVIEMIRNRYVFSAIRIEPKIVVQSESSTEDAKKLMELAHKYCLVSNTLKCDVKITPKIITQENNDTV